MRNKHAEAVSQAPVEEIPWAPEPSFPPVVSNHVRDALAANEPMAMLTALAVTHGVPAVAEIVKRYADDPNYGANARAWLAIGS
jgi:hypothetical protein